MKGNSLKRLATSVDPMISHLVNNSEMFARECANYTRPPVCVRSTIVKNILETRRELARQLHTSADGYGLEAYAAVPCVHSWVSDGTALMTKASLIRALQIRAATVSTWKDLSGVDSKPPTNVTHVGWSRHWGIYSKSAIEHGGPGSRGLTRFWRSCSESWSAAAGQLCALL